MEDQNDRPVPTPPAHSGRRRRWVAASAALALIAIAGIQPGLSFAKGGGGGGPAGGGVVGGGGTATPPRAAAPPPVRVFPSLPGPTFTGGGAGLADLHQFDITGFIQDAKVDGSICPANTPASNFGGSVTLNGITIVVPCNSIIQMPANTLTWANFVNPTTPSIPPGTKPLPVISLELHVVGNLVGAYAGGAQHVAGLIYVSQQSLNQGQGIITSIDYATGNIHVGSMAGAPDQALVQINDPNGRFGRAQSPDPRFSVDDANATIHASTGYPMCVPRTDPSVADDPLCPQKNRPKPVFAHCRDWIDAGLSNNMPKGGNLAAPAPGQVYCGTFVTPAATVPASATAPDPMQQAPFEVGDYITYAGTLMKNPTGSGQGISAHTIEAATAIFTQPGTKPSYVAIGQFGVGSTDPNTLTAVTGVAQEAPDRIFFDAEVTDPTTPVDLYLPDFQPSGPNAGPAPMGAAGTVHNRWITPYEMTAQPATASWPEGGGILTMMTGVQTARARLRGAKAPLGLLDSPTRNMRIVARTLCRPGTIDIPVVPSVNGIATGAPGACTDSMKAANGLSTGQYIAPNFAFLFPENAKKGQPVVPNDLWDLGFLINGEGPSTPPLSPTPW